MDVPMPLSVGVARGTWEHAESGGLLGSAGDGHAWALLGEMPETGMVRATIRFDVGASEVGLLLRASRGLDRYYRLRIDPTRQRIVFERFPKGDYETFIVERPLAVAPGVPIELTLLFDGSAFVAYLDGTVALSCRGSDHVRGQLGAFVTGAGVHLEGLEMHTRATAPDQK
jgi:beta-fructofuranosidase